MTRRSTEIRPVPGPDAFRRRTADARLSQAALILSVGAAVAGDLDRLDSSEQFPLPSIERLYHPAKLSVKEAVEQLRVDSDEYVKGEVGMIPEEETARAAQQVFDDPSPETAAALVEAGLHHPHRLIRTAAAAAALDTTGPRQDIIAVLEDSAADREETHRGIARTALAKVLPQHPRLSRLVIKPAPIRRKGAPSNTAVLTHGTFAVNSRWWRPGGEFYSYLDGLVPPLHLHAESFKWSGAFSSPARDLAAEQLLAWVDAENLNRPDLFAHSHGATVGSLATHRGLQLDRLVMLAWPVHPQWLPDLSRVNRVVSIRVRFDLVIMVDGGGQDLPSPFRDSPKVREHVNGWFRHSAPHEPLHWQQYRLADQL